MMQIPFSFLFIVVIHLWTCQIKCAPLLQEKLPTKEMEQFMKRFGYIKSGPENADALLTVEGFKEAVQQMQKYGGLPQTGEMDEATINLTRAARCGVPDVIPNRRRKRYTIGSEAWRKKKLTYFLANWPAELDPEVIHSKLVKAFSLWSEITPLRFEHKNSMDADLIIAFGRGPHGDGYPFDGPGSVLAHAFFPYEHDNYGGDVHFDDDENWIDGAETDDRYRDGVDFFTVAAHELGHSLGLGHSTVPGSIMFPYYKGYNAHLRLDYDDVYAMYSMYVLNAHFEDDINNKDNDSPSDDPFIYPTEGGVTNGLTTEEIYSSTDADYIDESDESGSKNTVFLATTQSYVTTESNKQNPRTSPVFATQSTPRVNDKLSICKGFVDAASLIRGELFVFKENYVWRFRDKDNLIEGYPVDFHVFFRGIPLSIQAIDAVYQRSIDYNIIFFTGSYYWIFDGNRFTPDSPLPLTKLGLPADLDHLDAAIVWAKNGKTYFFKDDLYWRFDETTRQMEEGYPQNITRWKGIERNINTAFTWTDGNTYFFKGDIFWRFDNQRIRSDEQYPLHTSHYWFGCSS